MNIEEDNIVGNLRVVENNIGHVHLADKNRNYPGNGHYDFQQTIDRCATRNKLPRRFGIGMFKFS